MNFICLDIFLPSNAGMLLVDWLSTKWNWASAWSILSPSSKQKQALPNKWFWESEEQKRFITRTQDHVASINHLSKGFFPHLIIHDDLVGHSVEQGGLRDELFLGIFVFLFTCLLDIVRCQCVETGHLVLLMISVVKVPVNSSGL